MDRRSCNPNAGVARTALGVKTAKMTHRKPFACGKHTLKWLFGLITSTTHTSFINPPRATMASRAPRAGASGSTTHGGGGSSASVFARKASSIISAASDHVRRGTVQSTFLPVSVQDRTAVAAFVDPSAQLSTEFQRLCKHYRGKMPDLEHAEIVISSGEQLQAIGQFAAATDMCFRAVSGASTCLSSGVVLLTPSR